MEVFILKGVWSDLFSIFCARVTKLRKFRNTAIVTNCKAFKTQCTLGPIFSRSFTRAPRNCREGKGCHCYKLQSIFKSFQSKITPSDFFLDLLCALQNFQEGKNAIVTNCKVFNSHFKVKSLGQILYFFFDLLRARVTKL